MGLGGISIWQLLIILAIVIVIFGARKLRNLGSDVGAAVKGFKDASREGEADGQAQLRADATEEESTAVDPEAGVTDSQGKTTKAHIGDEQP